MICEFCLSILSILDLFHMLEESVLTGTTHWSVVVHGRKPGVDSPIQNEPQEEHQEVQTVSSDLEGVSESANISASAAHAP